MSPISLPLPAECLLLTPEQMGRADALTIAAGTSGTVLMQRAGEAVADAIVAHFKPVPVLVICGPGNNGGDGYVVAEELRRAGWPVTLVALRPPRADTDAAWAAQSWTGAIRSPDEFDLKDVGLVVDAMFGAGLDRDVTGIEARLISQINASNIPVVAIDVPSGIDGATGAIRGVALKADLSVTFAAAKPGHMLMPGRDYCGERIIADIGISTETMLQTAPTTVLNRPILWRHHFEQSVTHKYSKGHCLVLSGDALSGGAARLAAFSALRAGAGLVSMVGGYDALLAQSAHVTSVMLKVAETPADFSTLVDDRHITALVLGPAAGVGDATRQRVLVALQRNKSSVLDADALSSFATQPASLFDAIKASTGQTIFTPHDGEFSRLFPDLASQDKLMRARTAAKRSGAIVVLKGPDTVIAAPDGLAVINDNAPNRLATAGSGDVLAGLIGGLLAQGWPAVDAASAGVWLHGEAANQFGLPGMIAEDLPDFIPLALQAATE